MQLQKYSPQPTTGLPEKRMEWSFLYNTIAKIQSSADYRTSRKMYGVEFPLQYNCKNTVFSPLQDQELHYIYFSGSAQKGDDVFNFQKLQKDSLPNSPFFSNVTRLQSRIYDISKIRLKMFPLTVLEQLEVCQKKVCNEIVSLK